MKVNMFINVSMNEICSDVMRYAWILADQAAKKHGGKPFQYVGGCMRKAWDRVKSKYYRVNDTMQVANYLAAIAEIFSVKKARVLDWYTIRTALFEKGYLPENPQSMSYLESVAIIIAYTYLCRITKDADLQIMEPLDIRQKVISTGLVNENRVALNVMCDNAAECYGFDGMSWTNDYLSHCERTIYEMYRVGRNQGYKLALNYITQLFDTFYILKSEKWLLEDVRYHVYDHYKKCIQDLRETEEKERNWV